MPPRPATPASPPVSDTRPGLWLRLTVALVGVFAFVQMYSVQSILPQLQRDLDASVVQVGNAVGMTVLAVALISPFIGMLSDAFGRKAIVVASVFALAVPTALMSQVETVHGLLVLRFLQGLAVPGVSVVIIAYIGEEFRGAAMVRIVSVYVAGSVMGGFLGRFLLGHLAEYMPWRTAFLAMAALNLAGAVLVWRGLPASRRFVPDHRISVALTTLGSLLHNRALQVACALGFTLLFVLVGLFTYVNLHLAAPPYGFSSGQLANIFAVYLLGVVVTPLAGRVIARIGARRSILSSLAVSAVGVLLTLVSPAGAIVAGLAIGAIGVFISQSATMSFIAYRIQAGRSLASGLYYAAYYGGGFAGAWLGGMAYTWGDWPGCVALLVAVQALGWVLVWRLMPGLPSRREAR